MAKTKNRWTIAIMGIVLQLTLGTVYAWSYFQQLVMNAGNWTNTQAAWAFSLAIFFLGLSAAVGGLVLGRVGPRILAMSGALLFGVGYFVAAYAIDLRSLPLLYLGYGVLGGIGLGLGYVTPVATVAKWFPDKKGLVTGMVVMGFGFGALFMAKVLAPLIMAIVGGSLSSAFYVIGGVMLVMGLPAAYFMVNPPKDFMPGGYAPRASVGGSAKAVYPISADKAIMSARFVKMWVIFLCNITAGIMFIGFQSPLLQDLLKRTASAAELQDPAYIAGLAASGATLIAISSIFNGVGRFFWGGLSDKLGRITVFRLILGSQLLVFIALLFVDSPLIFGVLVCYILLCYGGGFGSMPSDPARRTAR